MVRDAASRLQFINLIMGDLDQRVNQAWNKTCQSIATENSQLTDCLMTDVFKVKHEFWPADAALKYRTRHLRESAPSLHPTLRDEFDDLHTMMIKDYRLFRSQFKALLSNLCQQAVSAECFRSVLPEVLTRAAASAPDIPIRSAQGIEDAEAIKAEYKEVLEAAVYYTSIRQMI